MVRIGASVILTPSRESLLQPPRHWLIDDINDPAPVIRVPLSALPTSTSNGAVFTTYRDKIMLYLVQSKKGRVMGLSSIVHFGWDAAVLWYAVPVD